MNQEGRRVIVVVVVVMMQRVVVHWKEMCRLRFSVRWDGYFRKFPMIIITNHKTKMLMALIDRIASGQDLSIVGDFQRRDVTAGKSKNE